MESLLRRAMKRRFGYSPDFESLKSAIIDRNARRVSSVLRKQPELLKAADALGNNAVHWSVITRNMSLIDRFVEQGTPINARRADGQTPAMLAAHEAYDYWYRGARGRRHPSIRNSWVILGKLLEKGATYSISIAAAVGDQERIEQLLKRNPDLAAQLDSCRVSPLSYAAREGYTHIVQLLLEHGADPNMPEDLAPQGRALFEACGGNHLEVAKLLLQHGANPNAGVDSSGCCLTICKYHYRNASKQLIKLLKKYGAYKPAFELTVSDMKRALRKGHEVVQDEEFVGQVMSSGDDKLLDQFLKLEPKLLNRLQVYGSGTYPNSRSGIRKLLNHGLDPNRPDWLGRTFLHACAERGDVAAATVFLEAGANINAKDIEFQGTPLAAAVRADPWCNKADREQKERQRKRMVKFLLKWNAATNLPDDEPWATPLAWAQRLGRAEIEAMLREKGATA